MEGSEIFIFTPLGLSVPKMADRFFKHFGDGTIYDAARRQSAKPVKGPWTNHSIKIFLAKREEGEKPESDTNSKDPDGLVKAIGIVGMYHGRQEMLDRVKECVEITQVHVHVGVSMYRVGHTF